MAARGPCDNLSAALESHLGQHTRHVVLDGLLGDTELVADLPVCEALSDELNDAALHRRKAAKNLVVTHTDVLAMLLAGRGKANGLDNLL
jgi:hypothetical protein